MNFIVGGRQVESLGQGPPQLAILDEVARALQRQNEGFSLVLMISGNASGGFLYDKVSQEPFIVPSFGIVT